VKWRRLLPFAAAGVAAHDLVQRRHTLLRNYPVLGHGRYLVELKSVRAANYIRTLRRDLIKVAEATGVEHPSMIGTDDVEILTGQTVGTPLHEIYGYERDWGYPSPADQDEVLALMADTSPEGGSAPPSPTAADRA
jgi:hypothetical protein